MFLLNFYFTFQSFISVQYLFSSNAHKNPKSIHFDAMIITVVKQGKFHRIVESIPITEH